MNKIQQARCDAARYFVDVLELASHDGDPAIAAAATLTCIDAIAEYAHRLCDQKLATSLQTETPEP